MRCVRAQAWMAAAVDDELGPRRRRVLERHLTRCAACRGEQATTARLLGALDALAPEAMVSDGLEQATFRRVRGIAAEEEERAASKGWRAWLPLPAVALAAAAVLAVVIGLRRDGEQVVDTPGRIASAPAPAPAERIARATPPAPAPSAEAPPRVAPPAEPPPELAAAPELFIDLPILRNLEKLSHFETIRTTTVDGADRPVGQEAPSSG